MGEKSDASKKETQFFMGKLEATIWYFGGEEIHNPYSSECYLISSSDD